MYTIKSKYFYGHQISDYGLEHRYVDYKTLAEAFQCVLANDIILKTNGIVGYWEQVSGWIDNSDTIEKLEEEIEETDDESLIEELQQKIDELQQEQDYLPEVFQYYIVDYQGYEILSEIGEVIYYNEELDLYIWGVTHYGTSWDYVLTDIPVEIPYLEEDDGLKCVTHIK